MAVISPDGTQLSYISVDLVTFSNDLYLSNLDGSNKIPVLPGGNTPPVDDHLFTRDGKTIIFSMVNPQTSPTLSWLKNCLESRLPQRITCHPIGTRPRSRADSRTA